MILDNQTPWQAILQVADLGVDPLAAVVISKATYDIAPDGGLTASSEPLPILPDPLPTPFGEFHGEFFFRKAGADLAVLATIRRTTPTRRLTVRLEVDAFKHELRVSGDRVWVPTGERKRPLQPSSPTPFTEMPLSYSRAFGGSADYEGYAAAWPDNPLGLGYYLSAEQAREHAVPNIEAAEDVPVEHWDQRPRVAGWGPYPMHWGLRASSAVQIDPQRMSVQHVSPAIFNHAHPDLVRPEIVPGTTVRVDGVWDTPLVVTIPRKYMLVRVVAGRKTTEVASRIDGVFLWMDARKLVITQRANFGYAFVAEEARVVLATVAQV